MNNRRPPIDKLQSMLVFAPAKVRSTSGNVVLTALQASIFWLVFLVAAPWVLSLLESGLLDFLEVRAPQIGMAQKAVGVTLLVGFGVLNLWSGATMAIVGRGTPFPLETARELVVKGPFRFVRNPMVVGGLGAGLGVAILLGLWSMALLVFLGGLVWHLVARPPEERDLELRFGESYRQYRRKVRLWIPTLGLRRSV